MIKPVAGSLHGYLAHSVHLVEVVGGSGVGLIVVGDVGDVEVVIKVAIAVEPQREWE